MSFLIPKSEENSGATSYHAKSKGPTKTPQAGPFNPQQDKNRGPDEGFYINNLLVPWAGYFYWWMALGDFHDTWMSQEVSKWLVNGF